MTLLEKENFGFDVDMEAHIEKHGFSVVTLEDGSYTWVHPDGTEHNEEFYSLRQALVDCIEQNYLDEVEA